MHDMFLEAALLLDHSAAYDLLDYLVLLRKIKTRLITMRSKPVYVEFVLS